MYLAFWGFQTRTVFFGYIKCLRYTILDWNPWFVHLGQPLADKAKSSKLYVIFSPQKNYRSIKITHVSLSTSQTQQISRKLFQQLLLILWFSQLLSRYSFITNPTLHQLPTYAKLVTSEKHRSWQHDEDALTGYCTFGIYIHPHDVTKSHDLHNMEKFTPTHTSLASTDMKLSLLRATC